MRGEDYSGMVLKTGREGVLPSILDPDFWDISLRNVLSLAEQGVEGAFFDLEAYGYYHHQYLDNPDVSHLTLSALVDAGRIDAEVLELAPENRWNWIVSRGGEDAYWRALEAEMTRIASELRERVRGDLSSVHTRHTPFPQELVLSWVSQGVYRARECTGASPIIDGRLDDEAWSAADATEDFVDYWKGDKGTNYPTKAWIAFDATHLYLAFRGKDPLVDRLRAGQTYHDAKVWLDDSFEVFLDTNRDYRTYYHLIVNSECVQWDGTGEASFRASGQRTILHGMLTRYGLCQRERIIGSSRWPSRSKTLAWRASRRGPLGE